MKFRFQNIGPIRDAEIELGDLTILAGKNNTGKTYLAYTLHGFLESWAIWPGVYAFMDQALGDGRGQANGVDWTGARQMDRELAGHGAAEVPICPRTMAAQRTAVVEALVRDFSAEQIARVFSSPASDFPDARLAVECPDTFADVPERSIALADGGEWTMAYENGKVRVRSQAARAKRRDGLDPFRSLYYYLLMSEFPQVTALSSERFSIPLFYRELDFTKNRIVEMLQEHLDDPKSKAAPFQVLDRTSRYAMPIRENIDYTRSLPDLEKWRSEIYDAKLFNQIRDMMDGYFVVSNGDVRFISRKRKNGRFDIGLHRASSSARGLSDFYFFLRHAARTRQLLLVDEPESHLDTDNQILLARLLANLVAAGIRVLVTTHSDYLMKEINNLLMLGNLDPDDETKAEIGYKNDVPLHGESVRAYMMENGTASPCAMDQYGLSVPNVESSIERINQTSYDLAGRITRAFDPDEP